MRIAQFVIISLFAWSISALAAPLVSRPIEGGPAHKDWEPVAAQNGESLLYWSGPAGQQRRPNRAWEAVLLVPLPASDVQARLGPVLKREGFRLQETTAVLLDSPIRYPGIDLAEGARWWELYLSHHPEIQPEVSDARLEPHWQEGLASGAILPADLEALNQRRVQKVQGSELRIPPARAAAELRSPQTVWQATLEQRSRSGDQIRTETIRMYDVSRLLGATYTAVTLIREDSSRNPDYNPFKLELCIPGPCGKPARRSYTVVPYASLTRLLAELPADTLIADSPLFWAKPAAKAPSPDYREVPAAADAAVALVGEGFDWKALGIPLDRNASPSALLVLPDGDVLVAETHYATAADSDSSHVSTVYRHRFASSGVQSQLLWQIPKESSFRMALARDGRTLWFSAHTGETLYMQRYNLQSGEVVSEAMPGGVWQLDSAQRPRFYDAVPDYQISQWRPEGEPQLLLAKTLRAKFFWEGVGKLQPVYGHQTASEWAADNWGLAELDLASGKTLRSIPLPVDASSTFWAPPALAAPDAGWIARPWLRSVTGQRRGWGAYIVDTRQGKIRFSVAMDQPGNVMRVMARSANGRLLALGQEWDGKYNNRFGLWDVTKGTSPVNLQLPAGIGNGYLRGLAFSPDGRFLYALSNRWLVRWALPAALQDKALPGNWPA